MKPFIAKRGISDDTDSGILEAIGGSVFAFSLIAGLLLGSPAAQAATWAKVNNLAPSSVQLMAQMTDGTILIQSYDGQTWMKLTPDIHGSYINGTWSLVAPALNPRIYFASQVLPNGKFWLMGGEYSGPGLLQNWSNTAEIYDPATNTWAAAASYPAQPGCPPINYVSANLVAGNAHITSIYPYTSGLVVGWAVSGAGIPAGATIVSIDSPTQITISAPATATRNASEVLFNHSYTLTACFGDDPSMLLPGGQILAGDLVSSRTFLYNWNTDSWAATGNKVYPDSSDEEGWVKLADGTVLTYDLYESIQTGGSYAEVYNPRTSQWSSISPSDGSASGIIPQLSSSRLGFELGPLLRLQDGRVLAIGATQHTALYTPSTMTWAAGNDVMGTLNGIPSAFGADDAPAAVLPNGHVILAADAGASGFTSSGSLIAGSNFVTNIPSTAILQVGWSISGLGIPSGTKITSIVSSTEISMNGNATVTISGDTITFGGTFSPPTQLFDFNPASGLFTAISPAIPDVNTLQHIPSYLTRMLVLPTGQLLFSDASAQLWVYTPDGGPAPALRPVINNVTDNGGGLFKLTGQKLNGQSAGAAYGDDDQMDSNYPLVRMTNMATGNVYYAKTTNWSSTAVDGGSTPETVDFTLNAAVTAGNYSLTVIGAGISSFPVALNVTTSEVEQQ